MPVIERVVKSSSRFSKLFESHCVGHPSIGPASSDASRHRRPCSYARRPEGGLLLRYSLSPNGALYELCRHHVHRASQFSQPFPVTSLRRTISIALESSLHAQMGSCVHIRYTYLCMTFSFMYAMCSFTRFACGHSHILSRSGSNCMLAIFEFRSLED